MAVVALGTVLLILVIGMVINIVIIVVVVVAAAVIIAIGFAIATERGIRVASCCRHPATLIRGEGNLLCDILEPQKGSVCTRYMFDQKGVRICQANGRVR